MNAYKFLAAGAVGRFSDVAWPPAGEWLEAGGPLEECRRGVHACRVEQLLDWLDDELWEVELDGVAPHAEAGLVAERGRLLRRLERWDDEAAHAFADACAERARGHAAAALGRRGYVREADALADATTLAQVRALAAEAAGASDPLAAEATAFAADCLLLARGARPEEPGEPPSAPAPTASAVAANLGFVSAHVAGRTGSDGAADDDDRYAAAFAAERAWQRDWLRRRLEPDL